MSEVRPLLPTTAYRVLQAIREGARSQEDIYSRTSKDRPTIKREAISDTLADLYAADLIFVRSREWYAQEKAA